MPIWRTWITKLHCFHPQCPSEWVRWPYLFQHDHLNLYLGYSVLPIFIHVHPLPSPTMHTHTHKGMHTYTHTIPAHYKASIEFLNYKLAHILSPVQTHSTVVCFLFLYHIGSKTENSSYGLWGFYSSWPLVASLPILSSCHHRPPAYCMCPALCWRVFP